MSRINRNSKHKLWHLVLLTLAIVVGGILVSCSVLNPVPNQPTDIPAPPPQQDVGNIVLNVKDERNQLMTVGVVVQVSNSTQTDNYDNDEFRVGPCDATQMLIAWAPGYKMSFVHCDGQATRYDISLAKLNTVDNANYIWVPAGLEADQAPNCAGCHTGQRTPAHNEFFEWRKSGHARVMYDRFLETMYLGTDLVGNRSSDTTWDILESHLVRRAPQMDGSYRGSGYRLDFPTANGNCAYCHVPAAVGQARTDVNLGQYFPNPGGSIGEGVTCDVCHKVFGLQLDDNGYPYVDRPGILSFQFLRAGDPGERLYMGPLAGFGDVNSPSHSSTCSSVFSKSEFCAACHYGKFANVLIYGSYDEWRNSVYGQDPASPGYQTCQDCHMSPAHGPITDGTTSQQRQACSANNLTHKDLDHNMLNYGLDPETNREIPLMIKNAATVKAEFDYDPTKKNWLTVTAKVRSKDVGHRFPTDSPLRHLILVVEVRDQRGTLLSQVDGDRIPIWGGAGDIAFEDPNVKFYAALPGKIFANLLVEEDTGISPTAAYWNETKYAWVGALGKNPYDYSDTRLIPGIVDTSKYSFDVPDRGNIKITIKLIYRFAFFDLMRQKGWKRPDILVTSKEWNCVRLDNSAGFDCQ